MSAMQEWETTEVLRLECRACGGEFFPPRSTVQDVRVCPYCERAQLSRQNREFEVSVP